MCRVDYLMFSRKRVLDEIEEIALCPCMKSERRFVQEDYNSLIGSKFFEGCEERDEPTEARGPDIQVVGEEVPVILNPELNKSVDDVYPVGPGLLLWLDVNLQPQMVILVPVSPHLASEVSGDRLHLPATLFIV